MSSTEFIARGLHEGLRAAMLVAGLVLPDTVLADLTPHPGADHNFHEVVAEKLKVWEAEGLPEKLIQQIEAGADGFLTNCASCHGELGEGGSGYPHRIVGGQALNKFRTGQRLFVYNASMMPFQDPGSLAEEEVWNITAWIMAMNGWLNEADSPLGPDTARSVQIRDR